MHLSSLTMKRLSIDIIAKHERDAKAGKLRLS
jgi:hypothetical protein